MRRFLLVAAALLLLVVASTYIQFRADLSAVSRELQAGSRIAHSRAHARERQRGLAVIRDIFPVSLKPQGLRNDALVTTTAASHGLERISAPTLAISVSDDLYGTVGGARHVTERIPGARLIAFPTGGHAWLGHDAEVRDQVVTFLRAAAPAPHPP